MSDSVFLRALGAEAGRLRPEVREYVAGPPRGYRIGRGRGVFEVAGSPYRAFAGLLRLVCGPEVALTRYEREVPFEIVNRPDLSDAGIPMLHAERDFLFAGGAQRFVDVLLVGALPGTLVNIPGSRGRLELLLECSATAEGSLRLRSRAARIRIGRRRIRLPRMLSVQVEAVDGWDAGNHRRTIDASVRHPVLGTVLRYRGWFQYDYEK